MRSHSSRRGLLPLAAVAAGALVLSSCSAGDVVGGGGGENDENTLTLLIDNAPETGLLAEGLAAAFEASHEGVDVQIETRPGGSEGDNIVKTRLSTGDMTDVFIYNTGSLLQALDPAANLVPMDDTVDVGALEDTFLSTVTVDGQSYGTPWSVAQGGGILYNRAVYDDLGLEVPRTWDEFMANNAAIEEAGIAPVIQTYEETWTSQLFVLGDYHNIHAEDPSWAEKYTKNQVKYSEPPAIRGFQHLEEVHEAGYLNENFASANVTEGLEVLARGEGVHYPILSGVLPTLLDAFPEQADDIGFFGIPGEDPAKHGLTVWPGLAALYIPKTTEGAKLELAREFQAFLATPEGCDVQTEAVTPMGPYLVDGCALPEDVPPAVDDIQAYFEEGNITPALEFLSPVKGPALEQICVEVGSGITSAEKGAQLYDQDVEKQAQQLGLPGWE